MTNETCYTSAMYNGNVKRISVFLNFKQAAYIDSMFLVKHMTMSQTRILCDATLFFSADIRSDLIYTIVAQKPFFHLVKLDLLPII